MKKLIISSLMAAALFMPAFGLESKAASDPAIYIEGERVSRALPSAIVDGTSYVSLRGAADIVGGKLSWNESERKAEWEVKGLSISAGSGDIYLEANGRVLYAEEGIFIRDGRIMIPCRLLAKALGGAAGWDGAKRSVYITQGKAIESGDEFYKADELMWLSRIISAESRGEPMRGQAAVGGVVLNRVEDENFPATIYGVIFDRKNGVQFEPVINGSVWDEPYGASVTAAKLCLEGVDLSRGALYFYNPELAQSNWIGENRPYIMTIGTHRFYG